MGTKMDSEDVGKVAEVVAAAAAGKMNATTNKNCTIYLAVILLINSYVINSLIPIIIFDSVQNFLYSDAIVFWQLISGVSVLDSR